MYLKSVCASFCSELISKSGWTHVCHYSWNGQLWLHQNECTFQKIHSLSTGGAHSRVEATITSPTSPPYVAKQLTALFHTQPLFSFLVHFSVVATIYSRIQVKAQPGTRSSGPRSPTRLGRYDRKTWAYPVSTVLATVAFLLLLDTSLLSHAGIMH